MCGGKVGEEGWEKAGEKYSPVMVGEIGEAGPTLDARMDSPEILSWELIMSGGMADIRRSRLS